MPSTTPRGQTWSTFLHTHAKQIWACEFLPVTDLFFHSLFAFFIIELHSRKVIHVGVTGSPTYAWTAQQLRVAKASSIEILKTLYHTPRTNAICERFLGGVRRECLDHLLVLQEKQLQCVFEVAEAPSHSATARREAPSRLARPVCVRPMAVRGANTS